MLNNFATISEAIKYSRELLKTYGETVTTESWQGLKQERKMFEFLNLYWAAQVPSDFKALRNQCNPSLPWADKHFEERVGGIPLNPGESYKSWPFYRDAKFNDENFRKLKYGKVENGKVVHEQFIETTSEDQFTHTYMERYWPKHATQNESYIPLPDDGHLGRMGIRYEYGDLQDVVNLLAKEPYTRQAYLPVWFPEDTGVLHGGRVPCTIGYHFIMRHNRLNIHYQIRACDYIRHFHNDIYLTCRLLYWVIQQLDEGLQIQPGLITFDCISFHTFDQEKNLI